MKTIHSLSEHLARLWVIVLVIALALLAFVGRQALAVNTVERTITVRARMPEQGGWQPGELQVKAGQSLHLRLVSEDVMHGFTIGQSDQPALDLVPGKVIETTLLFDQPGKYTYYCTRWCGPNHWRMRGTIDVLPADGTQTDVSPTAEQPLYVQLGLNIDAPHPAQATPSLRPSAGRGEGLDLPLPAVMNGEYLRSHSPSEIWTQLRADARYAELNDGQVWDLVALLWFKNTTPERLTQGQQLYAQNCAACHGEAGDGAGVMADALQDNLSTGERFSMVDEEQGMLKPPSNFTDSETMLGASPALLHGKILRGGMGTGMPYWGPVLTDEQIWTLVEFLWSFQFDVEVSS